MNRHWIGTVASAILVGNCVDAHGQLAKVHIDRYTIDDGLAQSFVTGTAQDRAGFLWVATHRGLQRFDGRTFVEFSRLIDSGRSPPELAEAVVGLFRERGGLIWAATPTALFRIDPMTRRFSRVPLHDKMTVWAPDSANRLWYVDGAMLKCLNMTTASSIDDETSRFVARAADGISPVLIATSRSGVIWLAGTENRSAVVLRVDLQTRQVARHAVPDLDSPLGLSEDDTGTLWLSTAHGLAALQSGAAAFRPIESFRGHRTTGLVSDGRGDFVVATDEGLARIDHAGGVVEQWAPRGVFTGSVLPVAVTRDNEGAFWISTVTKGLLRFGVEQNDFATFSSRSDPPLPFADDVIMALLEQQDRSLWVGTLSGGAYRVAPDWSRVDVFRHSNNQPQSLASDIVWDFAQDRAANLWVATAAGLCKRQKEGFQCRTTLRDRATSLAVDRSGWFWMATPTGIASFDPEREQPGDSVVIPSINPIAVFSEPDSNLLWIAGQGVMRMKVDGGRIVEPPRGVGGTSGVEPFATYALHRDRRHRLWRGTEIGLQLFDPVHQRFAPVDVPEIGRTTVFSVAEDTTGRLWLGTARGLAFYSPESGAVRRYARRDGFLGGELNRRAVVLRRNGSLVFGGVEGLTQFDPQAIASRHDATPVMLTRWRRFSADGVADAAIDNVRTLRLEPKDDAFTIEFAAMSFVPRADRRFRYRLEGAQSAWVETTEPVATFSRPRAGDYVLRIQTTTGAAEETWSEPGAAVTLDVIPPFWSTRWFEAFVAAAILTALVAAHRLRLQRVVAEEQLRLRISRDLHDEIGAGLSSIALMSDGLKTRHSIAAAEQAQLNKIGTTAREMVGDLRDIVWAIDPSRDRLDDVVTRMKDVAMGLLPGVRLTFNASPGDQLSAHIRMAERRELLLMYKEILHNVAKHAGATAVSIVFEAHGGGLMLRVADDGTGLVYSGNGNGTGLKSLRERAARLGGNLVVGSGPAGGTVVELTVRTT